MGDYRKSKDLIKQMRCYLTLKDAGRLCSSIGPPGGGNHFIEADRDRRADKICRTR